MLARSPVCCCSGVGKEHDVGGSSGGDYSEKLWFVADLKVFIFKKKILLGCL